MIGASSHAIPELGFGCMRLPTNVQGDHQAIDLDQVADMVDAFMAAGFGYFDTARGYHEGESEGALKKVLVDRYPREAFRMASKLPAFLAKDAHRAQKMFYISLEDLGVGYFDRFLLHNLGGVRTQVFEDFGIWDFLYDRKEDGLIDELGFSFHGSAEELESIFARHPTVDFVQLQINYADWESATVQSRKCYETALSHGLPVIVMEPLKGGLLASPSCEVKQVLDQADPDLTPAAWAFRFVSSLPGISTVLSGMSTIGQMDQNIETMRTVQPLGFDELLVIEDARKQLERLALVPCTACGYCREVCPQKVNIPVALASWNVFTAYNDLDRARENYLWAYQGRASRCVACRACETVCPQQIGIITLLQRIAHVVEPDGERGVTQRGLTR